MMGEVTKPAWAPSPALMPSSYNARPWEVLECPSAESSVGVTEGKLFLPRPRLRQDILVHRHEMRHILRADETNGMRWTGTEVRQQMRRKLEEVAVEVVEQAKGLDIRQARDHLDLWGGERSAPTERWALAANYLQVVYSCTPGGTRNPAILAYRDVMYTSLDAADRAELDAAWHAIVENPSHANCEHWADVLGEHFALKLETPTPTESQAAKDARSAAEAEEAEAKEDAERAERRASDTDQTAEHREFQEPGDGIGGSAAKGAMLDIHWHTTARRSGTTVASQWRQIDTGTVVRRPELLIPSGRVFGARASGGGILIDWSGSMSFALADLRHALGKLPRLWAAAYSGGGPHPYCGRLCVIAKDGRIGDWDDAAERAAGHQRGNSMDYLALEYMLAHAPRPYVWVSDGYVLSSAKHGAQHYAACGAIMARHGIARVDTLEDGIKYLRGETVDGYRDCPTGSWGGAVETRRIHR